MKDRPQNNALNKQKKKKIQIQKRLWLRHWAVSPIFSDRRLGLWGGISCNQTRPSYRTYTIQFVV